MRGFALLGVFGANLFVFSGYNFLTDVQKALLPTAGTDKVVYLLEQIFIENKFMGLFSFLWQGAPEVPCPNKKCVDEF